MSRWNGFLNCVHNLFTENMVCFISTLWDVLKWSLWPNLWKVWDSIPSSWKNKCIVRRKALLYILVVFFITCISLLYSYFFFCPYKPSWIKIYIWTLTMISVILSVSPCMFYILSPWAGWFHIWCIYIQNCYVVIVNDVLLYHKVSFLLLFNAFRIVFKGDLYSN